MENTESKIKNFEKLSKMLVIKPANEVFSQFSDMSIDDIGVNGIDYEEDEGLYYVHVSIYVINSLESYERMKDIIFELCHMFLNTSEYVFTGNFILALNYQLESDNERFTFEPEGDRQSNGESLETIKKLLEDYVE